MSLNGLDDPKIKEAHDAAIGEPGGWFLLKYVTRDEVDLLDQGAGGILEIRKAIAAYEEPSPLFGFLKYRRRNVLIKYVPEGVSRLVQARVTVHFGAVSDKLSPHDTIFEIETSKQLKDSALSAACSLHTAPGSTSSSTSSLRQRRLLEISEEEEDNRRHSTVVEEHASVIGRPSIDDSRVDDSNASVPGTDSPNATIPTSDDTSDSLAQEHDTEDLSLAPTISITSTGSDTPRPSISQERPSFQGSYAELDRFHSYSSSGRQKVKLGPRPSLDVSKADAAGPGRPRPVSSLPAGLKLFSRSSHKQKDSIASHILSASRRTFGSGNMDGRVLQNAIEKPLPESRPGSSSGASILSTTSTVTAKTMTPEKAKLMKALEMRKKKMAAPSPIAATSTASSDIKEEPAEESVAAAVTVTEVTPPATSTSPVSIVDIPMSADASNSSVPASPLDSSVAQERSTRASSISKSTGDTLKDSPTKKDEIVVYEDNIETTPLPPSVDDVAVTDEDSIKVTETKAEANEAKRKDAVVVRPVDSAESSTPELQINGDAIEGNEKTVLGESDQGQNQMPPPAMKIPQSRFSSQKENEVPQVETDAEPLQKQRPVISPIITDAKVEKSRPTSEADLANDDALMNELQSATVQEAKPMPVPKSPGRALFSTDIKRSATTSAARTVSNPTILDDRSPTPESRPMSSRSVSASNYLSRIGQQQNSAPLSKKVNVGGGIAQRIKALEKLSTTTGGAPTSQPNSAVSPGPSATFFTVRKTIVPGKAPSIAERASSLSRRPGSQASMHASTRDSSPEQQFKGRGRTLSTTNRHDHFASSPNSYMGRSSVHIGRDTSRPVLGRASTTIDYSDRTTLDPEHARMSMDQSRALAAEVRSMSRSPEKSDTHTRRSSVTTVKDLLTGRRQSVGQDSNASGGTDDTTEKKPSRASRMLSKMSSTLSSSRKTATVKEESEPAAAPQTGTVTTVELGDVNVQFPDNLLWKRRQLQLDSQGYLTLTQSLLKGGADKGAVKKYHLSEFQRPAVPDIDMEEMPNSVVLGFVEGSGLQFACADRGGQMGVLKTLQEAHAAFTKKQ